MAYTASEQQLYDFAKGTIPGWLFQIPRAEEVMEAFVHMFDRVLTNIGESKARKLILQSTSIWLDMHAVDRGTTRQDGESDEALAARLRTAQTNVTRTAIITAAQAIVDAEVPTITGTVVGLELKRDKAFFGTNVARTGTGGEFVDEGAGVFSFLPSTLYALPLEVFARSGEQGNPVATFSSSASAGNDGAFEITGLDGNALLFANGSGVAEVDATAAWSIAQTDVEGNDRTGRRKAYLGRGYRMSGNLPLSCILILPYGCTAGTLTSVAEMLRTKKAFGVTSIVECRANP